MYRAKNFDPRIEFQYSPRPQFLPLHQRTQRWTCIVAHRRAGKTVACVNDLVVRAIYSRKHNPQYGYIAPFRSQAKNIAWVYLKDATRGMVKEVRESDLTVILLNGARISLFGADNPDALRGMYFDGVVIDEFGDCRPSLWLEVLLPALSDRKGWAVFIGTPKGKNQFYDTYELSKRSDQWLSLFLRGDETGILDPEELQSMRDQMDDAQFRREILCDFHAEVPGSYYAEIINEIQAAGRIGDDRGIFGYNPSELVNVSADLGFSDSTVLWFWQEAGPDVRVIRCTEGHGKKLAWYMDHIDQHPYSYDTIWLPHDAKAKTMQTGRSMVEQFVERFENKAAVKLVPNLSVRDGIAATRMMLPNCTFYEPDCRDGIDGLRGYRRKYDETTKSYADKPLHDNNCFVAGTLIDTPTGPKPIETLSSGDSILLGGLSWPVYATHTRRAATLVLEFADGATIECTSGHKFFTTRGLVTADSLRYDDEIFTATAAARWSQNPAGIREAFTESFRGSDTDSGRNASCMYPNSVGVRDFCTGFGGRAITARLADARNYCQKTVTGAISRWPIGRRALGLLSNRHGTNARKSCSGTGHTTCPAPSPITITPTKLAKRLRSTGTYTPATTATSPSVWTSITSTVIRTITRLKISVLCLGPSICATTAHKPSKRQSRSPGYLKPERRLKRGTARPPGEDGTAKTARPLGSAGSLILRYAANVARGMKHITHPGRNIAAVDVKRLRSVNVAATPRQTVYDLTIDHHHAYVANGCLVSNSDYADSFRYLSLVANRKGGRKAPPRRSTLVKQTNPGEFILPDTLENMFTAREQDNNRLNVRRLRI